MGPEVDPTTARIGLPLEGDTAPRSSRFAKVVQETQQAQNPDVDKPGPDRADHPSVVAKSRGIDGTRPSAAVAGVAAAPAFEDAVFAPLASDPPSLAGLAGGVVPRTAGAAAEVFFADPAESFSQTTHQPRHPSAVRTPVYEPGRSRC